MKPLARYATLSNFVELGQSLGLEDPARLVREVGLDPAGLRHPDRWVPAEAIVGLLERSAAETGRADFGLALAQFRRFSSLGPLSMVIREEPDVRHAVRVLIRHQNMYNEALSTRLVEAGGMSDLRVELDLGLGHPVEARQATEMAVGVLHSLLQGFISPAWRPVAVSFTHPAPPDQRIHHRMFGPTVSFDQPFNGITLYTKDLDTPNAMSDPQLRRYAQQLLPDVDPSSSPTTEQRVRELIELLLPTGRCSVEQVARSLGVDRRTLHRRLESRGQTFSSILDATRADLAGHMVGNRNHSLTEVSEVLGFSSPGNFSRWFRGRFGESPSQWRKRQREDQPAVAGG